ncbi:MAG TPA: bacterial transcriptional activator domain-containing protein [Streptosporangiaceae bacterium]|nr:bacterial transcriptional activator domain-containing protein [Streptosporangiaceae bacterium]
MDLVRYGRRRTGGRAARRSGAGQIWQAVGLLLLGGLAAAGPVTGWETLMAAVALGWWVAGIRRSEYGREYAPRAPESELPVVPAARAASDPVEAGRPLISLMGPISFTCGRAVHTGKTRQCTREVAAYLGWHEHAGTSRQISMILWPYATQRRNATPQQFHDGTSQLRHILRALVELSEQGEQGEQGEPGRDYLGRTAGDWGLNEHVEVDVRHFHRALAEAADARSDAGRLAALDRAVAYWRGEFAFGLTEPWVEEIRQVLRDEVTEALCRIAELRQATEPERARYALARADEIDPDSPRIRQARDHIVAHENRGP